MSMSTTLTLEPLSGFNTHRGIPISIIHRSLRPKTLLFPPPSSLSSSTIIKSSSWSWSVSYKLHAPKFEAFAANTDTLEPLQSSDVLFSKIFPINITELLEGKIFVRLDQGKDLRNWELTVGCNLPRKWILHWGVSHLDDVGSE
ncbi:alpha-amylase 3, chloroplastic-like [Arachis hypogaea]|uniref:alpha-amylase 3, chloroplastic-like n=1 Tax=Arachis hypogaea TaxID=3818 RepID=UPI0007AF5A67